MSDIGPKPVALLVAIGASAVALCGCGSASPQTASKPTGPTGPPADHHPRIEGAWKVQERPRNYDAGTGRVKWKFKPKCDQGACSARITSTGSLNGILKFDPDFNSYTLNDVDYESCSNGSGTTVEKKAYRASTQVTLHVDAHRVEAGQQEATRLKGKSATQYKTTNAGSAAGCSDVSPSTEVDTVIAIRVR
jgi:hypothetical protein